MPFEREYSNFPEEKIKLHNFKNVDENIASTINEINRLRSQGHFDLAAELIKSTQNTPNDLSQYIIDSTTFRTLEEEIYNTQIYAKQKQQFIYFEKEEPDALYNDVWISDKGMDNKPIPPVHDTEIIHTYSKTCALSDGIWEGAVLSDDYYVNLCDKSTISSWIYYHNLGLDVSKIVSINGTVCSNNDYNFIIKSTTELNTIDYTSKMMCCATSISSSGTNMENSPAAIQIKNSQLGYVYVDNIFTNKQIFDGDLDVSCLFKIYVYADYIKFEWVSNKTEELIRHFPIMSIQMKSTSPIFSFVFNYTD